MAVSQQAVGQNLPLHLPAEQQDQLEQVQIAHPAIVGLLLFQLLLEVEHTAVKLRTGGLFEKPPAVHGQVDEKVQLAVLERIGKQPSKGIGVEMQLQNAAALGPGVGAVGDAGVDHQIFVFPQGHPGLEQGKVDLSRGADDQLHRGVEVGGKMVQRGQILQRGVVHHRRRIFAQQRRLEIILPRHSAAPLSFGSTITQPQLFCKKKQIRPLFLPFCASGAGRGMVY